MHNETAGTLIELENGSFLFVYDPTYPGDPVSLSLPVREEPYTFESFPPFFDGLLPEGPQLEALLKIRKLDRYDYFSQLVATGEDLVGAVSVMKWNE